MRPDAKAWVVKAEKDFKASQVLARKLDRDLYESVGFHAQQAVEKYLKAYLTQLQIPFQRIHDLTVLVNTAARSDPSVAGLAKVVAPLNRFAVAFRYPGAAPRKVDVNRARKTAALCRGEFRRRLGLSP